MASTVVEVGRTRVIPFRLAKATEADLDLETTCDNGTAEIARPGKVLAGEQIGFLRVLGKAPGTAVLHIGAETLSLAVVPPRTDADLIRATPKITTPASGAAAWGGFAVGIEWFADVPGVWEECWLTAGSKRLEPVTVTKPDIGPTRLAAFQIGSDDLAPGLVTLIAHVRDRGGRELQSEEAKVLVVKPNGEDLAVYEAEDWANAPRPERFARGGRVPTGKDPAASGGEFVNNASADPPLCINWYVTEEAAADWYQVMLVAAGDIGAAALPTVGINVEGRQQPSTNGRIAMEAWHRCAIGLPFRMEPGQRIITPHFENAFAGGKGDRRALRIDRVEVLRLRGGNGSRAGAAGTAGSEDAMTGGAMAGAPMSGGEPKPDGAMQPMMAMTGAMAGGAGVSPAILGEPPDPTGVEYRSARIGWRTNIQGLPATGPLEVEAALHWDDRNKVLPPITTLMVNGAAVSTQRTNVPRFWIDPTAMRIGDNTVRIAAKWDDGRSDETCDQVFTWQPPAGDQAIMAAPLKFFRFGNADARWNSEVAESMRRKVDDQRRVGLFSGADAELSLPDELAGTFRVFIEGKAVSAKGGVAEVALQLQTPGNPAQVTIAGKAKPPAYDETTLLGTVELSRGRKVLALSIKNDSFVRKPDGKGEPAFWLDSLILSQVQPGTSSGADSASIVHPPASDRPYSAFGADAVVVRASGVNGFTRAEVLLDGKPSGVFADMARRPGPVVLPMLLRGLTAGEHTVSVRLGRPEGEPLTTEPRRFIVLEAPSATPSDYERAVRLLDRFAFGYDPRELAAVLTMGEKAWLADRLARPASDGLDNAAFGASLVKFVNPRTENDVINRVLYQSLTTANPARDRFVLWTQNHFTTWIRKVDADRKWREYASFQRMGVAPFYDLLRTSAESTAMVYYLDQQNSYASRLNENYAREIMELHTVGVHGGYVQKDVTSLAKLLTGWTAAKVGDGDGRAGQEVRDTAFRFDPKLNDPSAQTVFGVAFEKAEPAERFDRIRFMLEMLASHPSTSRFVCRSLAEDYVAMPAPDQLVEDLAAVFRSTGGDMQAVLLAMAGHPAFWAADPRLAHPIDYAVRLYRAGGRADPGGINGYLRRSRQGLFDCATPDGHPSEDSAYSDSNAMIQRWKLARDTSGSLVSVLPGPWRYGKEAADEAWAQQVIDLLAVRLTGRVLGGPSNAAAMKLASELQGTRDERAREIATLIAQLPEGNLR